MTITVPSQDLVLPQKFENLADTLAGEFVERQREIDAHMRALVAGVSCFSIGSPGIAKTNLAERLLGYIDCDVFKILMGKFTAPAEVFGPASLTALKDDRNERMIDGYMPTAQAFILDEIFKCSSATLNALLRIMNEGEYQHGSKMIKVSCGVIYAMSNELPEGDELAALYDRLVIKVQTEKIKDHENFGKMLQLVHPPQDHKLLTWAEVMEAQRQARKVVIPQEMIDAMVSLRIELSKAGIEPSDRKFRKGLEVVRAAAWLDECVEADMEHIRVLEDCLWNVPDEFDRVSHVVAGLADPLEVDITAVQQGVDELRGILDAANTTEERQEAADEVNAKMRKAKSEILELEAHHANSRRRAKRIASVKTEVRSVAKRVLMEVYGYDEARAERALRKQEQNEALDAERQKGDAA